MVDFRELLRNPKKLAIVAASGIAYYLLRSRTLPENPLVDVAAAGGAYFASTRTAGNVKAALEGVALGAGANLAITLAKKAPEVFAAAPTAGAPQPQPQPQQIVVQIPQPPQPQPQQPFIQVSPQILLSQSQTVSQAQQVSQQVSQLVEQLQAQLQQMGRQLEQMTQQSPEQTMPTEISPGFTFQPPAFWELPEEPIERKLSTITLPVEPSESGDYATLPVEPIGGTGGVGITYYTTRGQVYLLE